MIDVLDFLAVPHLLPIAGAGPAPPDEVEPPIIGDAVNFVRTVSDAVDFVRLVSDAHDFGGEG